MKNMQDDFYGTDDHIKAEMKKNRIRNYLFNKYLDEMLKIVRPPLKIKK